MRIAREPRATHLHWWNMDKAWRALDGRIHQYYSFLLNDVPQELVSVLQRRLADRQPPEEAPKIDRLRPGPVPHVRMPSPRS